MMRRKQLRAISFILLFVMLLQCVATTTVKAAGIIYEAENATLTGGAVVAKDHSGYTGSGFVGGFTDSNKGKAKIQFEVQASEEGQYDLVLRYANGTGSSKTISLWIDGNFSKQLLLPATANWDSWNTITESLTLSKGSHTIAYLFGNSDSGNVNIDNTNLELRTATPSVVSIPGKIEAENYSAMNGIATENCSEGTLNVGWIHNGDWLDYNVNVEKSGNYKVEYRIAGVNTSTQIQLKSGNTTLATTNIVNTGGWQTYQTVSSDTFQLNAGPQTIRVYFTGEGVNFNYFNVEEATSTPVPTPTSTPGSGIPDLVVTDIMWSPSDVTAGSEVTYKAVIKNQGTGASKAGVIHGVVFIVDGTTVNWSDNYTASIPAGGSVIVTATGGPNNKATWTSTTGTHTVKAMVDDINRIEESNENNNTSEKTITVNAVAGQEQPDLVVTDVTWVPSNPITGDEITYKAVIKNQGSGASPAGSIHGVVFAVNGTIVNWSDNYTASIPAGGSVTVTATGGPNNKATWTATTGTHTIRAMVDDINRIEESNENNNTLDKALKVNLPSKPDLVVSDVTWTPATPLTGNSLTFSAVIENKGTADTTAGTACNVSFYVNGTKVSYVSNYTNSIPVGGKVTLTQNGGSWTAINGIHSVSAIVDETNLISELDETNNSLGKSLYIGVVEDYGATLPYDTYEAEALTIKGGSIIGPDTTWCTEASEASGRKAVKLSQGQSVELTLKNEARGIVVRYSMPDSATGADIYQNLSLYVNDVHNTDISVTNRYAHQYGQYGPDGGEMQWSNTPGINHHRYFDESRILLDKQYEAGSKIKLQWDANDYNPNGSTYILIDFIETEAVPQPLSKPADYVSIINYGAIANDGVDDTVAMTAAIAAVNGTTIKGVWIPEGSFDFKVGTRGTTKIKIPSGVSVKGAGMWYSTIQGAYAGLLLQGGNVTISDFTIKAEETYRSNSSGIAGIEGNALNSTLTNLWIQHTKVGLWLNEGTSNALVSKCRVRDVWADGININGGTKNTIVEQCNFRNTGDDGMAMWSKSLNGGTGTVENCTFRYNTVQIPNLANGIGIYGGKNNTVSNNLILDVVDNGSGIQFGTNHGPSAFTGTLNIEKNKLVRCGSWHHDYGYQIGAIWAYWISNNGLAQNLTVNVTSNLIDSSIYSGIFTEETSTGTTVNYTSNTINNSGTYGVHVRDSARGTAAFNTNTVNGVGISKFKNDSPNFTATGSGNNW